MRALVHCAAPVAVRATTVCEIAFGPADVNAARIEPACPTGNGCFTLYYGYIQNPACRDATLRIIAGARPNFVVVGDGQAARDDIPACLHENGIRAVQYVALGYGTAPCATVDAAVDTAMQADYDGVFFDQAGAADNVSAYQRARSARVKRYGAARLVILNPGLVPPDASMFTYADIVCVENQYDRPLPADWCIPAWRWMAVQGDPASQAAISAQDSANRLMTFRANGGFWYYSSNYATSGATAIELPPWYADFASWVVRNP